MRATPFRITREELYQAIWETPARILADDFGISNVWLAKLCKRLHVPRPGLGYWAKIHAGRKPKRRMLPKAAKNQPPQTMIYPNNSKRLRLPNEPAKLSVPENLKNCDPIVTLVASMLQKAHVDTNGMPLLRKPMLHVIVSKPVRERALRILDCLIRALKARGCEFIEIEWKNEWELRICGEAIPFKLRERLVRFKDPKSSHKWDLKCTGELQFSIDAWPENMLKHWSDCPTYKLEEKLGEIVEWMLLAGKATSARRQEQRAEEMRRAEEARVAEIEQGNRARLESMSSAWRNANDLRAFIKACEATLNNQADVKWLTWARAQADRIDPLLNGYLETETQRMLKQNQSRPKA